MGGKGGGSDEEGLLPGAMAAQDENSAAAAAANDPIPRASGGGFDVNGRDPSELVPPYARQRPWTPAAPGQGAEHGTEWVWKERDADGNEIGPTIRLRIHSADPTAPAGSNAANGPIFRIQHGAKYQDADGNLYPQGIHNPDSPNYSEDAINDTHIPWPLVLKLPWQPKEERVMPADPERLAGQLTLLRSTDAEERIDAAEQLAGWWRHLERDQVVTAARDLAAAVVAESDSAATEAELHALVELANARSYTRDDLAALAGRSRTSLSDDDQEYAEILEDEHGPLFGS